MGLKLFPAGREQPGALLHSSPMGSFPSLYTGSIISSFYALSVTQIYTHQVWQSLQISCWHHGPCNERWHVTDISVASPGLRARKYWLLPWVYPMADMLDYFDRPGSQKCNRTNTWIIRAWNYLEFIHGCLWVLISNQTLLRGHVCIGTSN